MEAAVTADLLALLLNFLTGPALARAAPHQNALRPGAPSPDSDTTASAGEAIACIEASLGGRKARMWRAADPFLLANGPAS
jgi:hypothetical protein